MARFRGPEGFTVRPVTIRTMPVRYRKLRRGDWGVSITGRDAEGIEVGGRLEVLIRQRNGAENRVTVSGIRKGHNPGKEGLCR